MIRTTPMSDQSAPAVLSPRQEAKEKYRITLAQARREGAFDIATRTLALNDLFFLFIHVLGGKEYGDNDWVFDRCREFEANRDGFLDLWPRGHYKDLSVDTPIITANRGWVGHGYLVPGDVVFNDNGEQIRVLATTRHYLDSECYRLEFNDNTSIVCGVGHVWNIIKKQRSKRDKNGYRSISRYVDLVETGNLKVGDNVGALNLPLQYDRKQAVASVPTQHRKNRFITKIERIPSTPTNCIMVEGGTYLAGEKLIPTHNSTLITMAAAIQEILNNPEITIGIFSFNRPAAKMFLRAIKWQFESNEVLKELFSDVLYKDPIREAPKWSEDDGIVVRRKGLPREMTVEAWGLVDGMPTGRHFSLVIYDDLVTKDSVTSPDMIKKVTEAVEISFNLDKVTGETRRWMVGTRYHMADTYSSLIARGAVKVRLYAATKDGSFDGEPWLLTRENLKKKIQEQGTYVASCQLFNNPIMEGEQTFDVKWMRFWNTLKWDRMNRYILVDPASEKKKSSDYTVMIVMGLGPDRNYYVIDMIRDKLSMQEKAQRLFSLHQQYTPISVGYERYGMQSDIAYLNEAMENRQYRFQIIELGGSMPKNDRIRRLQPLFQEGRVWMPERLIRTDYQGRTADLVQSFMQDEYLAFPYMAHDDMLDCMARITDADMQTFFPRMLPDGHRMDDIDDDEAGFTFNTFDYLKEKRYA